LTKSFADYCGEAGTGTELQIEDAAIKTKAAADAYAQGKLTAISKRATSGTLKVLGAPNVKLGDAIEIKEMPDSAMNGIFQVRSVSHLLSKSTGFVTTIGWIGIG
jgi:hypothetical protein